MEEVQSKGASRDSRGCSITVQSEVFPINHNHSYVGYPSCISIYRYISIYFHILPYVSIIFYIYICVCTYISYMYPILPTKNTSKPWPAWLQDGSRAAVEIRRKLAGWRSSLSFQKKALGDHWKGWIYPWEAQKWRTHFLGVFFAFLWFPMISYFKFSCFFWGGGTASWCWILLRMNVENNRARGAIYLIRLEKWASDSKSFCLPEKQGHRSTELMMDGLDLS